MAGSKTTFYYHNLKSKFKLFAKKPSFIGFYLDRLRKYSNTKSFDAFIISYPKSGRTWLQKIIIEAVRIEAKSTFDLVDVSLLNEEVSSFPYMLSTHAGSSWEEVVMDNEEIKKDDWEKYNHGKIVFLYRDPRDVLVSQYYHIRHRSGYESFPKEGMIDNPNVGLLKIIGFMNKWLEYSRKYPDTVLNIAYDDLKLNTYENLAALFDHINYKVSKESINTAIENTTLAKMRQAESGNADNPWSTTKKKGNPNSFHSRKGIVGEYKTFFTEEEIAHINKIISENLDSAFNY